MKDYEKAAIGIGAAALGITAYQAYKQKQAVDSVKATDPSRSPVTTSIDKGRDMVGGVYNWFRGGINTATGALKGRKSQVIDIIKATPSSIWYGVSKSTDKGLGAAEAGIKYLWSLSGRLAKNSKEKIYQLTNKPFTTMGGATAHIYNSVRNMPHSVITIGNALTGIGSKKEHLTKRIGFQDYLDYMPILNKFKRK